MLLRAAAPRAHHHRDFDKSKPLALQHHQRLDFRIFERKTAAEQRERRTIHAHESRRRIAHRLAQNRPQHRPEKYDAQSAQHAAMLSRAVQESRSDHHLAVFALQRRQDLRNVARIVLAVPIHADHVVVAQLIRQPVARLHASAESQMIRQRQNIGARLVRHLARRVRRTVIHYQHRNSRHHLADFADHLAHRALFVECRNQDQQLHTLLTGPPLHES